MLGSGPLYSLLFSWVFTVLYHFKHLFLKFSNNIGFLYKFLNFFYINLFPFYPLCEFTLKISVYMLHFYLYVTYLL